jgi:8-oxo-dGTP diphosphatase
MVKKHQTELWDIYDKNRLSTGKTVQRGLPMKQDEYHVVVHVWIRNEDNRFLISQRSKNKTHPNMWETVGGSAVSGDDSLKTALKESKEEVGMDLDPKRGKIIHTERRQNNNFPDFLDVWLFDHNVDESKIICDPSEVIQAKLVSKEQILEMIEKGEFLDYLKYILNYV